MVQLRTDFSSQQISASFWCNMGQNFLECIRTAIGSYLQAIFFSFCKLLVKYMVIQIQSSTTCILCKDLQKKLKLRTVLLQAQEEGRKKSFSAQLMRLFFLSIHSLNLMHISQSLSFFMQRFTVFKICTEKGIYYL